MKLKFIPKNLDIDCVAGETVYDAAQRQQVRLPMSCRNGVCCICQAAMKYGAVSVQGKTIEVTENAADVLLCKAQPLSDCVFEMDKVYGSGELPVKKVSCQITSVDNLKGWVYRVILRLPAGKLPEFYAGQYLALHLPDKVAPSFYSIASQPGLREIELQIQADPHIESAREIIQFLENNLVVSTSMPYGRACLTKAPTKPLILIAAGTGFAQMKSLVEFMLAQNCSQPISLYWGVRQQTELYHEALVEAWVREHTHISVSCMVADIEDNQGVDHHNQLAEAVMRDHSDFMDRLVFVSGSPRLVYSVMDELVGAGLPDSQFFSDVLEYAPR